MKTKPTNLFYPAVPALLRTISYLRIPSLPRVAIICAAASVSMPNLAEAAAGRIVTGIDTGAAPLVRAFTPRTMTNVAAFFAYSPQFNGGVRVAAGDVNGDGAPDIITGSGPGAAHVKAFSGRDLSELHTFLPYGTGFMGGVFVATGDVNGDGFDDIITGTDSGAMGHVKVFDGRTGAELRSFFAYPAGFTGGVRVAAGDINGDGFADIITGAGPGGGPHVKAFDGRTLAEMRSFFAYTATFSGGVFVAAGDVDGDGRADIITGSGPGAGPHVKVFSGKTEAELQSCFA
jgi:trimeric autotransporter adhesin